MGNCWSCWCCFVGKPLVLPSFATELPPTVTVLPSLSSLFLERLVETILLVSAFSCYRYRPINDASALTDLLFVIFSSSLTSCVEWFLLWVVDGAEPRFSFFFSCLIGSVWHHRRHSRHPFQTVLKKWSWKLHLYSPKTCSHRPISYSKNTRRGKICFLGNCMMYFLLSRWIVSSSRPIKLCQGAFDKSTFFTTIKIYIFS